MSPSLYRLFHSILMGSPIIFSLLFFTSLRASELPDLGSPAQVALSATKERELGLEILMEIKKHGLLLEDVIIKEYLQGIGHRLIATEGKTLSPYQFYLINDSGINAFALPGGFVGVNTGLILTTESESELASVLAHEVAHLQQKHMARMADHMGRVKLSTIAGLIGSALLATQSPELAQGAIFATLGGAQQNLIHFTREHEKEADAIGIQTLAKAGFDPMGMPAFFHRMYQETRFYSSNIPEYFMTHPLTESRLMASQTRAQSYPYKQIPDSLQYHLVQARTKCLSFHSPHEATQYFAKQLKRGNYRNEVGTRYGYALSLLAERKLEQAKEILAGLLQTHPSQPLFQLAYAHGEWEEGENLKALNRVEKALKDHPHNLPLSLTYGDWLIKTGLYQKAITFLKPKTLQSAVQPQYWQLLSMAYTKADHPLSAHLALAQYFKGEGDLTAAKTQLKLAEKIAASPEESSKIEKAMEAIQKTKK